ncbi:MULTISPECIES: hypothetical protein [unclassified Campylobacter]|uniref:hypothetical protein n=1 Tax=unclassified Campylobacter TaxID=2593542 RepID=UPI001EE469F0|nr:MULTISPECIES: hypothetical protein [unclassified Campylobacter]
MVEMEDKKELRGIYNVTFNEKKATAIKTDIELIEDAVIAELTYYVKGWHNERRDKGAGAEHIKLHLKKGSNGEIKVEELLNLGKSIRIYKAQFKEPYKDNETASVYEWQNDEGVRFRTVIDRIRGEGHSNTPLSPSDSQIITFYSDRNLNQRMEFKNPKVAEYYKGLEAIQNTPKSQETNKEEKLANIRAEVKTISEKQVKKDLDKNLNKER